MILKLNERQAVRAKSQQREVAIDSGTKREHNGKILVSSDRVGNVHRGRLREKSNSLTLHAFDLKISSANQCIDRSPCVHVCVCVCCRKRVNKNNMSRQRTVMRLHHINSI